MCGVSARLAIPNGDEPHAVADHVLKLQAEGASVVFVTTKHTAAVVIASMQERGVDLDRLAIVDAISPSQAASLDARVTYIGSPTLLEMVALLTEKIAARLEKSHVVLCCLNTLLDYNHRQAVDQFVHYLAQRLQERGTPIDFVLQPASEGGEALERRTQPFVGGRIELVADA